MNWIETLSLLLGLLVPGFSTGAPIFLAFFAVCAGFILAIFGTAGFGMITNSVVSATSNIVLTSVPLFILMGELLFRSGSTDILFTAVNRLFGRLHGRLYFLVIALSTIFGALSGSIVAVAAMLGRSVLPTMKEQKYDQSLSMTTILAGASVAPIIPPSIIVIVLGSMIGVSMAGLLVAGLLPGFLISGLAAIYVWIRLRGNPDLAPVNKVVRSDDVAESLLLVLIKCLPFTLVIFCVIGFILLGIATPTEAAASSVIGALVTTAIFRRLSVKFIIESLFETVLLTASLMAVVAASKLFSQVLSFTGASTGFLQYFISQDMSALPAFIAMMGITFIACMFIDVVAYMLISVPIFSPLVNALDFDPIWFWAVFLLNITLGAITPPFGYGLFALKAAVGKDVSIVRIYRSALSVVAIFVIATAILYIFPQVVTFLPGLTL